MNNENTSSSAFRNFTRGIFNTFGCNASRLAKETKMPMTRAVEILKGKRTITINTALKLSKYFGNKVDFWLGIQNEYDIRIERVSLQKQLDEINPIQQLNLGEAITKL
jgi:addiction module HigA family antidote